MLKKTVTYKDFNGDEVSEDLFFHLTQAELVEMELSHQGGMSEALQKIIASDDGKAIISEFKKIILGAYGKKSEDGKRFIKTQQMREELESSEAYSTLFMELVTDVDKASAFIQGIVPQGLVEEATTKLTAVPEIPDPKEVVTKAALIAMSPEELHAFQEKLANGQAKLED